MLNPTNGSVRRCWTALSSAAAITTAIAISKMYQIGHVYGRLFPVWKVLLVIGIAIGSMALLIRCLLAVRKHMAPEHQRWLLVLSPILAIGVVEVSTLVATGEVRWIAYRMFSVFRWDLCVLGWFAVAMFAVTRFGRLASLPWILAYVLAFVAVLDLLFFIESGSVGNWFLLQYALQQWDFVRDPILAESGVLVVALVVVPLLLAVGYRIASRSAQRRFGSVAPCNRRLSTIAGISLFTLVAFAWPDRYLPDIYRVQSANLFVKLSKEMATDLPDMDVTDVAVDFRHVPTYPRDLTVSLRTGTRPGKNLVLFILESARAASLPPFSREGNAMPFVNSLADRSLVVERMYTTVPFTTEALVAILHGVHPPSTGRSYFGDIHKPALPRLLNNLGYKTAFFTSAELSETRGEEKMLVNMGFDRVAGAGSLPSQGFEPLRYSGFEDRIILQPVLDWIRKVGDAGTPFFVTVLSQQSHHDYRVPPSFPRADFGTGNDELEDYLNTLRYTDGVVAELFDGLEMAGLIDGTAFVFVGDHGEAFGEHGSKYHGHNVWEESIRVPFMIYDLERSDLLGARPGPFQLVDVMPTILDLVGVNSDGLDGGGMSILSPNSARQKVYVPGSANQTMALVTDSLKYIYSYRRRPLLAFDLAVDPLERNDLAHTLPPRTRSKVELELLSWQAAVNKQFRRGLFGSPSE